MSRLPNRREVAREKPMGLMRIYMVVLVTVAAAMLLVQMHIMENHVIESNNSMFLSAPSPKSPRTKITKKPIVPKKGKKDCDSIVDSDEDADEDLKPILKILCRGGYDVSKTSTTVDRSVLPKWSEILDFYGPPKILGLETCSIFRTNTKQEDRHVAPAGLFNTGTNLLDNLIDDNCDFKNTNVNKKELMTYEVPWGKHIPFSNRYNHTAWSKNNRYHGMDPSNSLPVLAVRDPYTWMQSMCKQPYAAQFDHSKSSCPNIVPYESDIKAHPRFGSMKYIPVWVKYDKSNGIVKRYESLGHLWNEWNSEYIKFQEHSNAMASPTDFPFIVVRLEDLTFHGQTVIPQICECAGGTVRNNGQIRQHAKIANGHNHAVDTSSGEFSGLLRSVIKYGNITRRRDGYPDFQLEAAKEVLDPRLMELLGYPYQDYKAS